MRLRSILATLLLFTLLSPTFAQARSKVKTVKKRSVVATPTPQAEAPAVQAQTSPEPEPQPIPSQYYMAPEKKKGVYTDADILQLDGTIMVQHADRPKPTALQTGSTVQKGDVLRVYDKSWVILKSHWGDRIGLDSGTVLSIDEYYFEGPDRQIRFILQNGTILLRTHGASSRQSFFEVQAGGQVVSVGDCNAILQYDAASSHLKVQYLHGQLSVIDKVNEVKFANEDSEFDWDNGKQTDDMPLLLDETVVLNFRRFFEGIPPLEVPNSNLVLPARDTHKMLPSKP